MNFDNICRLCLTANEGETFLNVLYENDEPTSLLHQLSTLNITISKEDFLPNTVCDDCLNTLQNFIKFKTEITKNESTLKEFYENLQKEHEFLERPIKTELQDEIIENNAVKEETEESDDHSYYLKRDFPQTTVKEEVHTNVEEIVIITDQKLKQAEENEFKKCVVCSRGFNKPFSYDIHLLQHTIIENEVCDLKSFCQYCGEIFYYENDKELHMFENHLEDIATYNCDYCDNIYEDEISLLKHEKHEQHCITTETTKFSCTFCERNVYFNDFESFMKHCKRHLQKDHSCRLCTKKFISVKTLLNHQLTHVKYNNNVCKFCSRAFSSFRYLTNHINTIHSEQNVHVCDICGKLLRTKSGLMKHFRKHANTKEMKKFVCFICGYSTAFTSDMAKHDRIHTNERPYKCSFVGCENAFKTQSSLNDHKRRHLKIKKHCEVCDATFSCGYSLKLHMTIHTGEKKYLCAVCGKKFSRKWYLRNHMKGLHKDVDPKKFSAPTELISVS